MQILTTDTSSKNKTKINLNLDDAPSRQNSVRLAETKLVCRGQHKTFFYINQLH